MTHKVLVKWADGWRLCSVLLPRCTFKQILPLFIDLTFRLADLISVVEIQVFLSKNQSNTKITFITLWVIVTKTGSFLRNYYITQFHFLERSEMVWNFLETYIRNWFMNWIIEKIANSVFVLHSQNSSFFEPSNT